MHAYRTHTCGALRSADVGANVRLSGWIHRKRDHGGLLFVDLRDHYGLTQLVAHPGEPGFEVLDKPARRVAWSEASTARSSARTAETINPNLVTGEIEVLRAPCMTPWKPPELPLPVFGDAGLSGRNAAAGAPLLPPRRETLHPATSCCAPG